jgi:sortase A
MIYTTPQPIGHIKVPAVGISASILPNVLEEDLALGAGHYPSTGVPGEGVTVGLAGHDVTIVPKAAGDHVFNKLTAAKRGEMIYISWGGKQFAYKITGQKVVSPTDTSILENVGHERLVMTTCFPPGSAAHRLITFALRVSGR